MKVLRRNYDSADKVVSIRAQKMTQSALDDIILSKAIRKLPEFAALEIRDERYRFYR
jgi:hypothetical protein